MSSNLNIWKSNLSVSLSIVEVRPEGSNVWSYHITRAILKYIKVTTKEGPPSHFVHGAMPFSKLFSFLL